MNSKKKNQNVILKVSTCRIPVKMSLHFDDDDSAFSGTRLDIYKITKGILCID